MTKKCELIVALDVPTPEEALEFLTRLDCATQYVKIGPRLYAMGGVCFLRKIIDMGYKLFLDLKLHDIPNTVASAVEPLASLGLWALTIHTSGGYEMMSRAVAMRDNTKSNMYLLGISVLTSLGGEIWDNVHPGSELKKALVARALEAEKAGLDGLVCSPLDLELLKGKAENLVRVVPGIRAKKVEGEDQTRVATAQDAAKMGANYIVVGRPIVQAENPIKATKDILKKLSEVEY